MGVLLMLIAMLMLLAGIIAMISPRSLLLSTRWQAAFVMSLCVPLVALGMIVDTTTSAETTPEEVREAGLAGLFLWAGAAGLIAFSRWQVRRIVEKPKLPVTATPTPLGKYTIVTAPPVAPTTISASAWSNIDIGAKIDAEKERRRALKDPKPAPPLAQPAAPVLSAWQAKSARRAASREAGRVVAIVDMQLPTPSHARRPRRQAVDYDPVPNDLMDGEIARFTYVDSEGEVTDRVIYNWKRDDERLRGHCSLRHASRTFRLDRVLEWQALA